MTSRLEYLQRGRAKKFATELWSVSLKSAAPVALDTLPEVDRKPPSTWPIQVHIHTPFVSHIVAVAMAASYGPVSGCRWSTIASIVRIDNDRLYGCVAT